MQRHPVNQSITYGMFLFCFVFDFHFSFLEAFNIFSLFMIFWNFTIICLDVGLFVICSVECMVDLDKETHDLSSGNFIFVLFPWILPPLYFLHFSLFGTLTIWMLNILDGSSNFLFFIPIFNLSFCFTSWEVSSCSKHVIKNFFGPLI